MSCGDNAGKAPPLMNYGEQQARFAPDVQQRATTQVPPGQDGWGMAREQAKQAEVGKACATGTLSGYLGSGRDALDGYMKALEVETTAGMLAAELAADLAVLRDSLPAVLPRGADAALSRLIQDARHARRGLR